LWKKLVVASRTAGNCATTDSLQGGRAARVKNATRWTAEINRERATVSGGQWDRFAESRRHSDGTISIEECHASANSAREMLMPLAHPQIWRVLDAGLAAKNPANQGKSSDTPMLASIPMKCARDGWFAAD